MKKAMMTLGLTICTVLFMSAQAPTPAVQDPNAPVATFETDVVDYGEVEQGGDGVRVFKFKNTGKSPLIISNARGSCGCTVPTWPKEPIKPGESGEIKVKYDTNRLGPINKTVTITSNAAEPTVILRIKGTVVAPKTAPTKENSETTPTAN